VKLKIVALIVTVSFIYACDSPNTVTKINTDGSKVVKYFKDNKNSLNYIREYYYPNGKLGTTGQFQNGKMEGKWTWYYENGYKKDEANLTEGMYNKIRTHWHRNGKLKTVEEIKIPCSKECCDGTVFHYDSLGILTQKNHIKNGLINDTLTYYYPNGDIFKKSVYKDDKRNGYYIEYHKNGNKWVEGEFLNGNMKGEWKWFDTLGVIERIEYANE
jgi:antitoxin component YwqK of YwqJK toxin-antitoxin module